MKTLFLISSLFIVHFAFSNMDSSQKTKVEERVEKKNLLENNLLKKSQPDQDLLEVVEEIQSNEHSSSSEGQVSLQLMKTKKTETIKEPEVRQLAQTPEPSVPDPEVESIDQEGMVKKDTNLKSLVHESLFEKLRVRRDLDVFKEDQEGLSLEDVEIREDFGNVEVRWKPQEDPN